MTPLDHTTVRRNNLALVLRHLRDAGPRSRARIAEETGLNKATVSSLVSELVSRRLFREGRVEREGNVGRPGQVVELDGRGICGIGVEINVDYVSALALDLRNQVRFDRRVPMDVAATAAAPVLDAVAGLCREAITVVERAGSRPVGVTVAVPGLVDSDGVLTVAANLSWQPVHVADELTRRLGAHPIPVLVDNEASLGAIAEYVGGGVAGTPDLVYVNGEVGVGGGIIVRGELMRGIAGFSGEIGHMPIGDPALRCGCGRTGCWETVVGLAALLRLAADADDPVRDPSLDLEQRLSMVSERAEAGDERTLTALHRVGRGLGRGAAVLVNALNPRAIVLGGYFARLGQYMHKAMTDELGAHVIAPDLGGCRVELSLLGFTAAARGGAYTALERVLDDPTIVPETNLGVTRSATQTTSRTTPERRSRSA